ncbi:hypothetical protein KC315_g724 [Hortaea werneckii]|nr:hypothetical protein KC315_g724 [Hortaea werneckii]
MATSSAASSTGSALPQKSKRTPFTDSERAGLRRIHAENPQYTQKELATEFKRQYNKQVTQGTVSTILGKRYEYLDSAIEHSERKKARQECWPDLEAALAQWVTVEQSRQPINGDILRIKASWFWHRLPQYSSLQEPCWSNGWLGKFKARKGIKEFTRHGEAGSVNEEETMAALAIVQARIAQYSPENQYNCDETGLFWKAMPERSLSTHRIAGIKSDKARITLHFCVNASGNHKLKPWIIGQYQKPTCFRAARIEPERLDCIYRWNKKAWMTAEIFTEWLRWFDRQMTGRKVVLLLDNFSAHIAAYNELSALPEGYRLQNTEVVWLPPNLTSKTQPLDQGIIASFKAIYKRCWIRFIAEEFDEGRDPYKSMNLLKAFRFIRRAWLELSSKTIANCWIHAQLQEAQQPVQQVVVQKEVQQLLQKLYDEERIQNLMDIHTLINPPEEVVEDSPEDSTEAIAEQFEPLLQQEDEAEDELVEQLERVTAHEAVKLLSRLRLHEEQSTDCDGDWLKGLDQYEKVLQKRYQESLQQGRLDRYFIT